LNEFDEGIALQGNSGAYMLAQSLGALSSLYQVNLARGWRQSDWLRKSTGRKFVPTEFSAGIPDKPGGVLLAVNCGVWGFGEVVNTKS
jgi:hypothetical protein